MNDILILMWLGDINRNLAFILTMFMVIYMIAGVLVLIAYCVVHMDSDLSKDIEDNNRFTALFARSAYWAVPLILFGLMLPSANTVRLAVALKAGAAIGNTQLGQKAVQAAEAVLDRIIKEASPK